MDFRDRSALIRVSHPSVVARGSRQYVSSTIEQYKASPVMVAARRCIESAIVDMIRIYHAHTFHSRRMKQSTLASTRSFVNVQGDFM
jgi:hypothetical protein